MPPARLLSACAKDELRLSVLLAAPDIVLVFVFSRTLAGACVPRAIIARAMLTMLECE